MTRLSAVVLVQHWQTPGLVIANCLQMLLRISYNARFIYKRFSGAVSLREFVPPVPVALAFAGGWVVTAWSRAQFDGDGAGAFAAAAHVSIGAVCFLGCIASIFQFDSEFVRALRLLYQQRRKQE